MVLAWGFGEEQMPSGRHLVVPGLKAPGLRGKVARYRYLICRGDHNDVENSVLSEVALCLLSSPFLTLLLG